MMPTNTYLQVNTLSQQEFEALFDNAAMGIITVNPNGVIVMVNHFALQQFGYEKAELLGQKIELLIPRKLREKHTQHRHDYKLSDAHRRPMGVGMDLAALKKDGTEFPVEVSLSTYTTETATFSIAFISDITIRKNTETALLQMNEELEQKVEERTQSLRTALARAQELGELKSRFVSMASHEFRTPLSTILSSAYLVAQYIDADGQSKRDKHIQRIVSSVNMLTDILNDFLSVGKIEEGKIQVRPSLIAFPVWMDGVLNELETVTKSGQKIEYQHSGDENVLLDPSLVKHIVQNLVSNAIKFSPENSTITVITNKKYESFSLEVQDQGIGIPEQDQQHLFERFFRGTNAINIQGTGLGLHIVGKYAELMNGTVKLESDIEHGTKISIHFNLENELL